MVRHFRVNWKVQKRGGELGLEPQFHPPLGLPSPLTSCKEKQTNKQKRRDQSVCRCLFDAIIELHAMDEKMFNNFRFGK